MINTLRLSDLQMSRMISGLISDSDSIGESFARSVWSLITEPGDSFASALISTLGAKEALVAEVNRISAAQYIKLIKAAGFSDETGDRFKNLDRLLPDARERWQPRLKLANVESMLSAARNCKAKLITPDSELWPEQLHDLKLGVPHCLWLRGEADKLASSAWSLAIVGSRMATSYGEWATTEIVSAASVEGLAVISGGAYGIDAISHRAALALELPTIAIMAGGVDRFYPSGNAELLGRVQKHGVVISEQAPGSNPTKWRFLQRNRLIAALGTATIVVEAGKRSGAINTAHHAVELSRPLGVVPGQMNSPASQGCHNLIRENSGQIITSAQDAVNLATGGAEPELFEDLPIGPLETRALDAMGRSQVAEPDIATKAGLTARELITALGRLQLLGLVAQGERGWRKLT